MKKKIFAILLVVGVILTMAMFASCNNDDKDEDEDEDLGEEINITISIKITADDGTVIAEDTAMEMSGLQGALTAYKATSDLLNVEGKSYTETDGLLSIDGYPNIPAQYEVPVLDENDEETGDTEDIAGMIWDLYINGEESKDSAKSVRLKDGDKLEWRYVVSEPVPDDEIDRG